MLLWNVKFLSGVRWFMDKAALELVRAWLIKAQHDLATARKVVTEPDPFFDTAIFHCQQAAEKAIKGFLVFHQQRFEKTHNIQHLIELAAPFADGFSLWLEAGERLTPYATLFRYLGDLVEPEREEFEQALCDAEGLYRYVLSLLPIEVHP